MVDVNRIVREILQGIDGVKVTYYHPDTFNKMPVLSYYELTTTTGFCADNAEQAQRSNIVIDVWAKRAADCSRIAIEVDAAMQADNWYREFSRDLPPEDGIYHKSMRFYKQIFF